MQNQAKPPHQTQHEAPEDFIEQVKQALEHIYDFPYLQSHALAQALGTTPENGEPAGHQLRRILIEAIEKLNPGHAVSVRSNPARLYNLMHLHYVGGMTLQETAMELGISTRQVYRDLRRGHESVAAILWANQRKQAPALQDLSSVRSEVARLKDDMKAITLNETLSAALKAVERLAQQRSVTLHAHMPPVPVGLFTNPTIAQQMFIHTLSQAIQQSDKGAINITLTQDGPNAAQITLSYKAQSGSAVAAVPVIMELVKQLNWKIQERPPENGQGWVIIRAGEQAHTLLIVDDNEGLVDLLKRYITGLPYRVVTANSGTEGLQLALALLPDVIIMDLMMPGMDGWELLQRLRSHVMTQHIPVMICSVINDPELAYSLGAAQFITKPIEKDSIISALRALHT